MLYLVNANHYHWRMQEQPKSEVAVGSREAHQGDTVKRIASRDLFGASREIVIEHAGRLYRMRITQHGKLILTA